MAPVDQRLTARRAARPRAHPPPSDQVLHDRTHPPAYAGPTPRRSPASSPPARCTWATTWAPCGSSSPCRTRCDCFIFVADLHAITVWQDPAALAAQTREIAAAYIACRPRPEARR